MAWPKFGEQNKKMKKKFFLIFSSFLFLNLFSDLVSAHCPLCTIGAGVAAAGAVSLGFSRVVVALLIGGFSMSMGIWFSKIIKKQFIKHQKPIIILGIFLLTFLPLLPIFSKLIGWHVGLFGGYGSLFNRTYLINLSLFAGFIGGGLVFISPFLSKKITSLRGDKLIPFQGMVLTILLLLVVGGIIQLLI